MKEIDDYNWDSLYRQTQVWMDHERIPGRIDTGCRSIRDGRPVVDICVPCRGNKSVLPLLSLCYSLSCPSISCGLIL